MQVSINDMRSRVLLYVPNLICYLRLLLIITAESCLSTSSAQINNGGHDEAAVGAHYLVLVLYLFSMALDAADGAAARALNQVWSPWGLIRQIPGYPAG